MLKQGYGDVCKFILIFFGKKYTSLFLGRMHRIARIKSETRQKDLIPLRPKIVGITYSAYTTAWPREI